MRCTNLRSAQEQRAAHVGALQPALNVEREVKVLHNVDQSDEGWLLAGDTGDLL